MREAAARQFRNASLRGLTTFAPPSADALVDVVAAGSGILVAVNAEKIVMADSTIAALTAIHVGYPDGIGAVWALRRRGIRATRIAGADLWLTMVERYAGTRKFYLIGSTQDVVTTVARRLQREHPGIELRYRDGFLELGDQDRLEADLRAWAPGFVLVAMGSPRQEELIARLYKVHAAIYMGLGGSFDIFAGTKKRAPAWLQRMGLEWSYRLLREPARLRRVPAFVRFVRILAMGRL